MGEETTRLREEIDRTRQDLTRDVDQLAEKTSPTRIAQRRVARVRLGMVRLKDKVMGTPQYTPVGYPGTYSGYQEQPAYQEGGSRLEQARATTADVASSARQSVAQVGQSVAQVGERTQERAQEAVTSVRDHTEGNPLAAGVIVFGVGWLASSLLPATEVETRAAHRAGEVAGDYAGPVMEQAKTSVQEVGQNLQESAQQATEQVKERAQDAAGTVREEARQQATAGSP